MTTRRRLIAPAIVALGLAGIGTARPVHAASQKVADCSFATLKADLQAGGDSYYVKGQCSSPITANSTITISSNTSLTAQGNDITIYGGGYQSQVQLISVNSGVSFGLTGLTLSGGSAGYVGGGAIHNAGTLSLTKDTFSGNYGYRGGALFTSGPATITSSTFSDNGSLFSSAHFTKGETGGAIYTVNSGSDIDISNSTISGNRAYQGAAIFTAFSHLTITNSTISGNQAFPESTVDDPGLNFQDPEGGAVYIGAGSSSSANQVTVANSTLSGNIAGNGGGGNGGAIYNTNALYLMNSTIAGNQTDGAGGGIVNTYYANIGGTIIANNYGAAHSSNAVLENCISYDPSNPNAAGQTTDIGYNLDDDGSCEFNPYFHDIQHDPQLGPLADNGGPTQTMALKPGSPAIDYIPRASALCPAADQRGVARPDSGETTCDIGAYEFVDPKVTATSLASSANPSVVGQSVTYTATVIPSPGGGTVIFRDGGTTISGCGAAPVNATSGTAACQVTYNAAGSHTISATYSGDASYYGSTAPDLTQRVGSPTAAWVKHFVVRRHGETVQFQWQIPGTARPGSRLLGFNVLSGSHRLNPRLIQVRGHGTHTHVYHYTARRAGRGPYNLMAVLANGTQMSVAHG